MGGDRSSDFLLDRLPLDQQFLHVLLGILHG